MNGQDQNRRVLCNIARDAFNVVSGLLARDQFLARELRSSATGSRQIYREECITVEMAVTLRERFPDHVQIHLFTPHEEARNGADWYWRFEKGDRAIHARVQAKRVQRTDFGQQDRDGHIDIDLPQLHRLRQATDDTGIPGLQAWLATYARFDATPPCRFSDLQECHHHRHQAECVPQIPSLWIAQAQEISDINRRRLSVNRRQLSVNDIIEKSLRLDCILPCIDGQNVDPGPASKGFKIQSGLRSYQDCVATIEGDALLRKEFEGALRIAVEASTLTGKGKRVG